MLMCCAVCSCAHEFPLNQNQDRVVALSQLPILKMGHNFLMDLLDQPLRTPVLYANEPLPLPRAPCDVCNNSLMMRRCVEPVGPPRQLLQHLLGLQQLPGGRTLRLLPEVSEACQKYRGFPMMIWHASVHSPIVACLTTPLLTRTHRPYPVHLRHSSLRTPTTSPLAKTSAHHSDHSLRQHVSALQQCDRQATMLSRRPDPYRSLRKEHLHGPLTARCQSVACHKQAVLKHLHCSRQCLHLLVHKRLLAHRKAVRTHDSGWRESPTLSLSDHIDTVRPVALTCRGRKTDNSPSSSLIAVSSWCFAASASRPSFSSAGCRRLPLQPFGHPDRNLTSSCANFMTAEVREGQPPPAPAPNFMERDNSVDLSGIGCSKKPLHTSTVT